MKSKTPKESLTIQTNLVMPNDTNQMHTLFGGKLLAWMDEVASICAFRHCNNIAVTASINNVSFDLPILNGAYVTLEAKVSRAFKSSMEIFVDVFVESRDGRKEKCNEAILTFVAIDEHKRPLAVPELSPETEQEKQRYDSALRRRQLSLVLAGKMDPKEATELKSLFLRE
jgi:acyl-CoA hydrolase|tara:strand:- start:772 stop:1284 length:513 start_codon:yes stop_codon:yes gene_type:complete